VQWQKMNGVISSNDGLSVGVIAPYAGQAEQIRRALAGIDALALGCPVEISTVDGFQGREKDLVVFSATRANSGGNIGFVSRLFSAASALSTHR
jgi:ATP-dependent RNA/DNA helicase IGHMBP2